MADERQKRTVVTAPYMSWATFVGFIAELNKKGAPPPRVDASLLTTKAGSVQRQIRGALEFFGLTSGESFEVTEKMRSLIAAYGTPSWSQQLGSLLMSYEPLLVGLDLSSATHKQLEEALGRSGLTGASPLDKASRFFLALAKEAGQPLSPHFKSLRPGAAGRKVGGGGKPKNGRAKTTSAESMPTGGPTTPPPGTQQIRPLPDLDFVVHLPESITEDETLFAIDHLIGYLRLRRKWFSNVKLHRDPQSQRPPNPGEE
ncbi:MAG TPA: hypothetical protein DGD08_03690 [Gemmatimonas aurantiaca]|jgi:hypothetical protein|nr:hypothetical protein [Gemmatimonas aurantiaca]